MRHLIIRNFGPIRSADLELGQINVIIGMQSSGKSCVLKTACYCAWVEKRLELSQKANGFEAGSAFIDLMADYYKMTGYIQSNTYIAYETNHVKFSYNHSDRLFQMKWKPGHWNWRRPKVSYIPADRNLVAAIPGWSSLSLDGNMIDFMADWDRARRYVKKEDDILNLGLSYVYDSDSNVDSLKLENGNSLTVKESSSGVQSLLPLFVHMDYLTSGQYEDVNRTFSYEQREERKNLLSMIYRKVNKSDQHPFSLYGTLTLDGVDYVFSDKTRADNFQKMVHDFTKTDHSEVFLEEPEDNLFPPTQCQLVNWMTEQVKLHNDMLFVASHSPYVLNQFIKNAPKGLTIFFTYPIEGSQYGVRQLSDDEVSEIYDNGVDMFFNFELYL